MDKSGSDERISSSANADSSDPFEKASEAVEGLYTMRDTYFPKDTTDKKSRIQRDSNLALAILDSISPETRKQSSRRAVYEYLRGKVLDVSPDYCKEAEDHLSKAVKLDPSLADAWLCLGNCLWKNGDLSGAKNCFSLALKKGPNKKILRQLSMLERRLAQDALGNAYLSSFFITGSWDQNKLFQSLKAYQNAEKDELANNNPDLYYNSAMANRYVENYERALSGFEAASLRDPGLNAEEEVQKLVKLLTKLEESSMSKGQMKSKRHVSLLSSLGNENIKQSLKPVPMQFLHEGLNRGLALMGRILHFIPHDNEVPLYYVVSDVEGSCFILSIYGLRDGVIKESDRVTLLEPSYREIHFCWKEKNHHFHAIRVDFMQQILVNGHFPSVQDSVRSTIHAQHILP